MIQTIELQKNGKKDSNNGAKACFISIILIFALYLFAVITSIITCVNSSRECVALTGNGGISNNKYYVNVVFFNLTEDGSTDIIKLEDFELSYEGKTYRAIAFNNFETEYKLVRNRDEKFLKVWFDDANVDYSRSNIYYDGVKLGSRTMSLVEMLFPMVLIETIAFAVLVLMVIGTIRIICESKAKAQGIKALNEKTFATLNDIKFNITHTFYLPSPRTGDKNIEKMMICADNKNKKFAFIDYQNKICKVLDYKDFVNYKLVESNGVDVESKMKYSILLDSTYSSTSSKNICKKLQLILIVNDENDTNIIYDFVRSGVNVDSIIYKNMSKALIEVISFLEIANKTPIKEKKYIFCRYCGVKNKEDASHCVACGSAIKE